MESLQIYCQEEKTFMGGMTSEIDEIGYLTTDFTYPNGWMADNKLYLHLN
jgi:hypothetical protein